MDKKALIDTLNNLTTGELSQLEARLEEVRAESERQRLEEIPEILAEAQSQLRSGDIKSFRKKVQHAVSRLGHLR
jgi:hypothetical protein